MDPLNLLNNNMMQFSMYENLKTGNIIIDMLLSTIAVSLFTTISVFIKDNVNITKVVKNNWLLSLCYRTKHNVLLEGFYVVRSWNGTIKTDFPIVIDALFWHISQEKYEDQIDKVKLHIPNLNTFVNSCSANEEEENNIDFESNKKLERLKKKIIFRPQSSTRFNIDDIQIDLYENSI